MLYQKRLTQQVSHADFKFLAISSGLPRKPLSLIWQKGIVEYGHVLHACVYMCVCVCVCNYVCVCSYVHTPVCFTVYVANAAGVQNHFSWLGLKYWIQTIFLHEIKVAPSLADRILIFASQSSSTRLGHSAHNSWLPGLAAKMLVTGNADERKKTTLGNRLTSCDSQCTPIQCPGAA